MKLCLIRTKDGASWVLPMKKERDVYFHGGTFHPGYALLEGHLTVQMLDDIIDERLKSSMYEAGEFCGLWYTDDKLTWAWSLVPENSPEVLHINSVIVPYGRYTPKGT